jgi:PAS domain S-box-containing protein
LEESEERLNLAADSANFGLWEWDLDKDEVWVSPTRRSLLGLPVSEKIRFENFISRLHVDDRDRIRQAIENAIENRKAYDSEFRVVFPDGSVRVDGSAWASAASQPRETDANGGNQRRHHCSETGGVQRPTAARRTQSSQPRGDDG